MIQNAATMRLYDKVWNVYNLQSTDSLIREVCTCCTTTHYLYWQTISVKPYLAWTKICGWLQTAVTIDSQCLCACVTKGCVYAYVGAPRRVVG